MHRRFAFLAALAGFAVYLGSSCADPASARTLCESSTHTGGPVAPASAAPVDTDAVAGPATPVHSPATQKPAAHSTTHDDGVAAAGGSSPAPGDDDAAANLGVPVGAGTRRHGLSWRSLLPGVIK